MSAPGARPTSSARGRAVVLMWHRLGEGPIPGREPGEEAYAVPVGVFERQLEILSRRPGATVDIESVASPGVATAPVPPRAIALTFDDGNRSDYEHALPALVRWGLRAAFFVSPARLGTPSYLSWDELRELSGAGMSIGAHGLDHTSLATLADPELRRHLDEARRLLEARLGRAPRMLSLPGGEGGPRVVRIAREQGFPIVLDSTPRRCRPGRPQPALPRFAVRRNLTLGSFEALAGHRWHILAREALRARGLRWLRRHLGEDRYARLRGALLGRRPVLAAGTVDDDRTDRANG